MQPLKRQIRKNAVLLVFYLALILGAFFLLETQKLNQTEREYENNVEVMIVMKELRDAKDTIDEFHEEMEKTKKEIKQIHKEMDSLSTTILSLDTDRTFKLREKVNQTIGEIFAAYKRFHNKMTNGEIPPRFLRFYPDVGVGVGNVFDGIAFGFLSALVTGRAFVATLDIYNLNLHFNNPGFDWEYHHHTRPEHKNLLDFSPIPKDDKNPVLHYGLSDAILIQNTEEFRKFVPLTLGNWKSTVIQFLFSSPKSEVSVPVHRLKQEMKQSGFERFIGIQLRAKLPESTITPHRFMECALWLANQIGDTATTAYFMASDTPSMKEMARGFLGNSLFYFNVSGVGPGWDFMGASFESDDMLGALIDWYMLGESEGLILTAASSYGITAANRGGFESYPKRFHIGGETQCTNPNGSYYLEKIYKSPMEIYKEKGFMEFLPFIH